MSEHHYCDLCGSICEASDLTEFSGQQFCPVCLESETRICDQCYDRIWADNDYGDSNCSLCQDCYDRYYARCDGCGCVVPFDEVNYSFDDEDRPLCNSCYNREERKAKVIHDYYYKPVPVFYGTGPRFIGVELEIDDGGERISNAMPGRFCPPPMETEWNTSTSSTMAPSWKALRSSLIPHLWTTI